jgi:hypothetical protein
MPAKQETTPMISFTTKLYTIGTWTILRLPEKASAKLPSRGQAMVEGRINGHAFQTPLEPDGRWSHWFKVNAGLLKALHAATGDTVAVEMTPVKPWPQPAVPADLQTALAGDSSAHALWDRITPMARWEWIRWIRATNKAETRIKRIEVARSKMRAGERRPCCWNRNLCTEPSVSKNGMLLEPTKK